MSKNSHYAKGDPELEKICASLPSDLLGENIIEQRPLMKAMAEKRGKFSCSGVKINDIQVPVDGASILARIYSPESDTKGGLPLLVWYHGGGFAVGHPDMDDEWCAAFVETQNIMVASIDYRLAPEYPFPIGINDSYAALKWLVAHSAELGVQLDKGLLVGGASAGGNIAAVMSIEARNDPSFESKITGQLLCIPVVCVSSAYPEKWKDDLHSFDELPDAPILNRKIIDSLLAAYAVPNPADPRASPLLTPSLANLPASVVLVAGLDPLRDEGILYERLLKESGVETKLHIYPAAPHGFHSFMPQAQATKKFIADAQEGVKWLLSSASQK